MEHKAAFLAVVLCFVVQACCELALPNYTSSIVDVGIQQSGIENPSAEVITQDTYDIVTMVAPVDDEMLIRDSYDLDVESGCYRLNDYGNIIDRNSMTR